MSIQTIGLELKAFILCKRQLRLNPVPLKVLMPLQPAVVSVIGASLDSALDPTDPDQFSSNL